MVYMSSSLQDRAKKRWNPMTTTPPCWPSTRASSTACGARPQNSAEARRVARTQQWRFRPFRTPFCPWPGEELGATTDRGDAPLTESLGAHGASAGRAGCGGLGGASIRLGSSAMGGFVQGDCDCEGELLDDWGMHETHLGSLVPIGQTPPSFAHPKP